MVTRVTAKNFFYNVKVSSYDGKRQAVLSENIKRMFTGVTINEAVVNGDSSAEGVSSAVITFNEHDFLPQDNHLRPEDTIDTKIRGEITNRPSRLLDLRFDSAKGYTFVSKEEMESGLTKSRRTQSSRTEPIVFVFQAGNKVELEWGYVEPFKSKKREFRIKTVSVSGGTNGTTVTLNCVDNSNELKKTKVSRGITFLDASGKKLTLKQTLFKIAEQTGNVLIFDNQEIKRLPPSTDVFSLKVDGNGDTAPPDKPIKIPRGVDYHNFLHNLAEKFNFYYENTEIPNADMTSPEGKKNSTGFINAIKFTPKLKKFKGVDYEFTYRSSDEGNTILNFTLNSAEGAYQQIANVSNFDEKGENEKHLYTDLSITEGEGNYASQKNEEIERTVKEKTGKKATGHSITHPGNKQAINAQSERQIQQQYPNTLQITTLGDPDYRPSQVRMKNIGVRYSTEYTMFSVQHILGNNGYTCVWSGTTRRLGEGGFKADELSKQNEDNVEIKITEGE